MRRTLRRFLDHRAGPAVLAAMLALLNAGFDIGRRSLWVDETASVRFTRSVEEMLADHQSFPYYLLLRLVRGGRLVSEVTLRLPSAIAFAVLVGAGVLLFSALRPAAGWPRRLAVGAVLALHPLLLWQAQEARAYALTAALLMLSALSLAALLETGRLRAAALLAVLATAAIYGHLCATPFVAVSLLVAFVFGRGVRRQLAAAGVGVALGSAWLFSLAFGFGKQQLAWVRPPNPRDLFAFIGELGGGYASLRPLGWALVLLLAVAAALPSPGRDAWRRALSHALVAAATLPVLLAIAASFVSPMTIPRYWMFAAPFAVVWAAARLDGAAPSRWRSVALGLAAVVALTVLGGSLLFHARGRGEGWRDAVAIVRAAARPGDRAWLPGAEGPFSYYAARDGLADVAPLGPCAVWTAPINDCRAWRRPALPEVRRQSGRVWVITNRVRADVVQQLIAARFRLILHRQLLPFPYDDHYADKWNSVVTVDLLEK